MPTWGLYAGPCIDRELKPPKRAEPDKFQKGWLQVESFLLVFASKSTRVHWGIKRLQVNIRYQLTLATSEYPFSAAINRGVYSSVFLESTSAPISSNAFTYHTRLCVSVEIISQILKQKNNTQKRSWLECGQQSLVFFLPAHPSKFPILPRRTNPIRKTWTQNLNC